MWKHSFPEASFQWNAGTQTTKHIWLMTHRSHGTLAFTDASDLPKPLEQIPMWTPLLKTTPARISCAVCLNSNWNSGFTSPVWTEGLHIKNCGGQGCIYTRSDTRSLYEVNTRSAYMVCPGARHELLKRDCSSSGGGSSSRRRRKQQQQEQAAAATAAAASSSSRKQQQQQEAAVKQQASSRQAAGKKQAVASSSSKQQQQAAAAASSSKQQQAAGKQQASSKEAASKQQPVFAPLKEWSDISFKNQRNTKIELFPGARPQNNEIVSIAKSSGDAKLELFPGARPPDTTFTSWYDSTLALVDDPRSGMLNPMSVKRILNAKGTAFTSMFSTREQHYFIPLVPPSTSACSM